MREPLGCGRLVAGGPFREEGAGEFATLEHRLIARRVDRAGLGQQLHDTGRIERRGGFEDRIEMVRTEAHGPPGRPIDVRFAERGAVHVTDAVLLEESQGGERVGFALDGGDVRYGFEPGGSAQRFLREPQGGVGIVLRQGGGVSRFMHRASKAGWQLVKQRARLGGIRAQERADDAIERAFTVSRIGQRARPLQRGIGIGLCPVGRDVASFQMMARGVE